MGLFSEIYYFNKMRNERAAEMDRTTQILSDFVARTKEYQNSQKKTKEKSEKKKRKIGN